jgi:hypothetical protein
MTPSKLIKPAIYTGIALAATYAAWKAYSYVSMQAPPINEKQANDPAIAPHGKPAGILAGLNDPADVAASMGRPEPISRNPVAITFDPSIASKVIERRNPAPSPIPLLPMSFESESQRTARMLRESDRASRPAEYDIFGNRLN